MLRVIQHFGECRPELLVSFSKTFLHLTTEHSRDQGETRICSTVLAKYILEKWKIALPLIRLSNVYREQSAKLYLYTLFRKGFQGLREGTSVICQKRSLKLSVSDFSFFTYSLVLWIQQHHSKAQGIARFPFELVDLTAQAHAWQPMHANDPTKVSVFKLYGIDGYWLSTTCLLFGTVSRSKMRNWKTSNGKLEPSIRMKRCIRLFKSSRITRSVNSHSRLTMRMLSMASSLT